MRTHGQVMVLLVTFLCGALLPAATARAQDPGAPATAAAATPVPVPASWFGIYAGGGGSYSNVSVQVGNNCVDDCYWWANDPEDNNYDNGDGAFGYSVYAGLRLNQYVALEVGYLDSGTIGWNKNLVYTPELNDFYNNRVDFQATVTEVSVLGILPFGDVWEVYLRLGAGFWDGQSTQRLDQSFGDIVVTRDVEDSGTGLLVGVGVGVTVVKGLQVRLDLQTVGIDRDMLNTDSHTSLDSFLLELQYRFGAD